MAGSCKGKHDQTKQLVSQRAVPQGPPQQAMEMPLAVDDEVSQQCDIVGDLRVERTKFGWSGGGHDATFYLIP